MSYPMFVIGYLLFVIIIEEALQKSRKTPLTEWFKSNQLFEEGRDLLYPDYWDKFVCNKQIKSWIFRKKVWAMGRKIFVSPKSRMILFKKLLLHIKELRHLVPTCDVHWNYGKSILYKERNLKHNCSVQINEYIELSGLNEKILLSNN